MASLRQELAEALGALEEMRGELAQARERIAELETRLRQTPRNSSKPPSSQGLDKPPAQRSLRKRSGRKPGGQDGHKGTTLAQVARPGREVRHEPGCCGRCGAGPGGPDGHRSGTPPGHRPARRRGHGDRASADRAGMPLRASHQGRRPGRGGGAGPVRAADRRDHRLPVRRAVSVQQAHRAGAGRIVRHLAVVRDGGGHHRPRR